MTFKRSIIGGIAAWKDGPRTVAADATGLAAILGARRVAYVSHEGELMSLLHGCAPDEREAILTAWSAHLAAKLDVETAVVERIRDAETLEMK